MLERFIFIKVTGRSPEFYLKRVPWQLYFYKSSTSSYGFLLKQEISIRCLWKSMFVIKRRSPRACCVQSLLNVVENSLKNICGKESFCRIANCWSVTWLNMNFKIEVLLKFCPPVLSTLRYFNLSTWNDISTLTPVCVVNSLSNYFLVISFFFQPMFTVIDYWSHGKSRIMWMGLENFAEQFVRWSIWHGSAFRILFN